MEAYLQAFVNFKQNDWAKLLLMAEFAYNNAKNSNTGHTPFELNCGYYPCVSFEEYIDLYCQSKLADEISVELRDLMTVCWENLYHAQELQKQAHNKGIKPRSYALGEKVWLNNKYIKPKCNRKLEAKFFRPFQVLYSIGKQAYKLELPKRWRMHNVFYMSLLEQNITKRERVDKRVKELKLESGNSEEYKVVAIWDSVVYTSESKSSQLPSLYYLIA